MTSELAHMIKNRRTAKQSLDTPVSKDLLKELLFTASYAPFHKSEPWKVKLITTEKEKVFLYTQVIETLKRNGEIHDEESRLRLEKKMTSLLKKAPATILFGRKRSENARANTDAIQATAALIQNFSLLLAEHDLVGFWATPGFILDDQLATTLGFSEEIELIASYRVGYRDHSLPVRKTIRQPLEAWVSDLCE